MEEIRCISCNARIINTEYSTGFKCPACGEAVIYRCGKCRIRGTKYVCPKCGFEGP